MTHPPTCQEDEDVSRRLCEVYLHDCNEGSVQVVSLCLSGVQDVHRVGAARDREDGLCVCVCVDLLITVYSS